jgi:hypothetical protein
VVILAICTAHLLAQENLHIASDDAAHTWLGHLRAFGLINSQLTGTKPYSRLEIARLILEADMNYQAGLSGHHQLPAEALACLKERFQTDIRTLENPARAFRIRFRPFGSMSLAYTGFSGVNRSFPQQRIDAAITPFTANTEGRTFAEGQNLAFESGHALMFGRFASFFLQGRGVAMLPRSRRWQGDLAALRYYLILTLGNVNLLVGKDGMNWGTGSRGNLILSRNAKPIGTIKRLPLVKLSNRLPVRLPWLLNGLGPARYTLFVSKLEKDRADYAYPFFIGLRFNFKSGRHSEFGLSHTYILGGENFPIRHTFGDDLAEFFFIRIRQNFIFNIDVGPVTVEGNIANHMMGGDFRFRFPKLRHSEIYAEIYADDLTVNLNRLFSKDLAFYGGLYIPRLTADGRLATRIEFTHTSHIFYLGTPPLTAGMTYQGGILGSDLGPGGDELYIEARFTPAVHTELTAHFDFQKRDGGISADWLYADLTPEKRYTFGIAIRHQISTVLNAGLDVRYQHVESFAHQAGLDKNNYYVGMNLRITDPYRR